MRYPTFPTGFLLFAFFLSVSDPALATQFTPMSAAELQANLGEAATNGQDDVIDLAAITYSTSDIADATFLYDSTDGKSLTLNGAASGGATVLDGAGGNDHQLLSLLSNGSSNSMISVNHITFQNAHWGLEGGGLTIQTNNESIQVDHCSFDGNTAEIGGGFFLQSTGSGSIDFTDNVATDNHATAHEGGGSLSSNSGTINFTGNQILNSTTGTVGGGAGGFKLSSNTGATTISGNQVLHNSSGGGNAVGGASVFTGTSSLNFTGNTFQDNHADDSSIGTIGGLRLQESNFGTVTVTGNLFQDQSSGGGPGAAQFLGDYFLLAFTNNIFLNNSALGGDGGAVQFSEFGNTDVTNNTFSGNSASGNGGGISFNPSGTSNIRIYNNIIFGNTASQSGEDIFFINAQANAVFLFNNDFSEICFSGGGCDPTVLGSNQGANLNVDPGFVDLSAGDVHLGAGSGVIGKGNATAPSLPSVDFDQVPLNNPPDLGALAATSLVTVSPTALDFGQITIGESAEQTVTMTNNGAIPLNVTGMDLSDTTHFSLGFSGNGACGALPFTLAPGESCAFEVSFAPDADGNVNATLTLVTDDANTPSLPIPLSGIGVSGNGGGGGGNGGGGNGGGGTPTVSGGACSMQDGAPPSNLLIFLAAPLFLAVRRAAKRP